MNNLLTDHPIALQALMSETIFTVGGAVGTVDVVSSAVDTREEVVTEDVTAAENAPPIAPLMEQEEFVYQGDKSAGVLFILRYPDYPYFSPQAEEAFVKTIGALQLTPQNVAVVNLANPHNPNDFRRIMAFFAPTKITFLGVEPASLKLPAIAHNSYMRGNKATVFYTFSFEEMFADVQKKKLFWAEFKAFLSS